MASLEPSVLIKPPVSVPQLKHWLACRRLLSTRLKTKAKLVLRVQDVSESEVSYIVDPPEDKTYSKRKHAGLQATGSSEGVPNELEHIDLS